MELGQLRHFLAVHREGNFAKAAASCSVTQQALSASIARLEKELGIRLFDRGRTGARSMAGADAFAPFVKLAFTELERGKQALYEAENGERGEIRFGIGQTFAGRVIPEAVEHMNHERPNVSISMVEGYAPSLAQQVINGTLDFFVGAPTEPISDYDLQIRTLFTITDQIICRASHPLTRKQLVEVKDLVEATWLFPSPPSIEEESIARAFVDYGVHRPHKVIYSDTIATAQALLVEADYLIVGQAEILAPLLDANLLTAIPTNFSLPKRIGCIGQRRDALHRPCVKRFIDIVIELSQEAYAK